MDEKRTVAKIAQMWCDVVSRKTAACKAAAERGVFDTAALHDLNEACENLELAFNWLPKAEGAHG